MKNSRPALVISKLIEKLQFIIGAIMALLFGLTCIVGGVSYEEGDGGVIFVCIIFVLLGIVLVYLSRKRHALIDRFNQYQTALLNDPTGSISNLASITGTSENVVQHNLEIMIQKKFFEDAYIDRGLNSIILASREQTQTAGTAHVSAPIEAPDMVTVSCKGCGGVNMVPKGQTVECEYCGLAIEG